MLGGGVHDVGACVRVNKQTCVVKCSSSTDFANASYRSIIRFSNSRGFSPNVIHIKSSSTNGSASTACSERLNLRKCKQATCVRGR